MIDLKIFTKEAHRASTWMDVINHSMDGSLWKTYFDGQNLCNNLTYA